MRLSVREVLDRLVSEGVAPAGAEPEARKALAAEVENHLPWYMSVAVAIGAWLATTFLLLAIFAISGLRSDTAQIVVGLVLSAGAIFARREADAEFARWAAVAVALAGMGLITAGVHGFTDSPASAAAACLVVALVFVWLVPDTTLRFLSTLAAGGALFVWVLGNKVPFGFDVCVAILVVAIAFVWRYDVAWRSNALAEILEPVGYALVIVLFVALLGRTFASSTHAHWTIDIRRDVGALGPLATIVCTAALLALTWRVLDEHGASLTSPLSFAILAGVVLLGAGTLDSPGIVAGVAALMLAFDRRNVVLLGMAAIFLIVFGSFYYYSLSLTLLQKSGVLLGSGLLLLSIRNRVARA
jgi:uncharacterized membrane protein